MGTPKGTVPWNAGTGSGWTDKRGYCWLYVKENGKNRARRAHRVIMERHLGRRLEPWEIVHHKDENPSNNALDNLELQEHGAHTIKHSTGSRKSYEARRSMEAFALMREELKVERALKTDLLAALVELFNFKDNHPDTENRRRADNMARAAIAAATSQPPKG
jgi:hypothetical protein